VEEIKMLKKITTIVLLLFVSYALVACAGKSEVQKNDDSLAIKGMMEENQKMLLTLATSMASKNACQATLTAKNGEQIEGLAGLNFICNPGGADGTTNLIKVMTDGNVQMANALAYDSSTEWAKTWNTFFAGGWDFAKTAAPWFATWKITSDLSDDYSNMNKHNNEAWSDAVGNVAENGGSTTVTTTTTSDVLRETVTSDISNTSTSVTETFGNGNTISGNQVKSDGSLYQSAINPPAPVPDGPPQL
jgi:hypothetical protein